MDQSSTSEDWPEKALPENVIKWLFDRMVSKWGKAFVDKWSVVEPQKLKREWGKALYGLSELEFRRGVAKLDDFERPPSQPEFLKACRPEVNVLNAYYEAIEGSRSRERGEVGTWSHPAIFWASVRVSAYELLNQTYSQIRGRWEAALAAELAKGQWDEVPAAPLRIAGPEKKFSREEAAKMMQQLKASSGVQPVQPMQVDPKRWAKKIIERHQAGDKTLYPIQIQFALQALGTKESDDNG